jgi:NADH-quinone oxidoreductase subunit N
MLQTLASILNELPLLQTEAILLVGAASLLLLVRSRLSQVALRIYVSLLLIAGIYFSEITTGSYFNGWVFIDEIVGKIRLLLMVSTLVVVWYIRRPYQQIEFYFFLLSGLVGALVMMNAQHFLLIYLGVELASFSSYFLTGMRLTPKSSEATLKYVLFGGVTSAVMLYGLSLVYGASGSLLLTSLVEHPYSAFGLFLFFAGVLFKASLIPFHLWVPSTYQEAPSDAVAFFSVVPKLASFVLIFHILQQLPEAYLSLATQTLLAVALVTVLWGTLSALPQIRLKRTIAFGAIAHSGFLLPMVLMGEDGLSAFSYYAVIYAFMNLAVFYLIHFHENMEVRSLKFDAFNGFGKASPLFGAAMVVILIALTGLPPTAGFSAKLLLFTKVYEQFALTGDKIWMSYLIVGVLSTVLSLFYYMKLPIAYFLKDQEEKFNVPTTIQITAATILSLLMLWGFIQPEILNSFVLP